jgi:hypothetical protein
MELTSHHRKWYGYSSQKFIPDPERCAESVHDRYSPHQCRRKRGHGPEGAFCKQHDPERVAAKRAEWNAKFKAEFAASQKKHKVSMAAPALLAALQAIAAGHNDPRAFAAQVLGETGLTTPPSERE